MNCPLFQKAGEIEEAVLISFLAILRLTLSAYCVGNIAFVILCSRMLAKIDFTGWETFNIPINALTPRALILQQKLIRG